MYRITGVHDLVPAAEVTATDLLGLLAGGNDTHPQACAAARNMFNQIVQKLNETTAAAASRLNDAFGTPLVGRTAHMPLKGWFHRINFQRTTSVV